MHIVVQSVRYFDPPQRRRKGESNQYIFRYADEKEGGLGVCELGNPCPGSAHSIHVDGSFVA
jgi:hypothetical protein